MLERRTSRKTDLSIAQSDHGKDAEFSHSMSQLFLKEPFFTSRSYFKCTSNLVIASLVEPYIAHSSAMYGSIKPAVRKRIHTSYTMLLSQWYTVGYSTSHLYFPGLPGKQTSLFLVKKIQVK